MAKRRKIAVSKLLPRKLREAALQYATDRKTDNLRVQLFEAFDISTLGDDSHRRATWLCVLATRKVLYGWQALECKGDKPAQVIEVISRWVKKRTKPRNWQILGMPAKAIRNGKVIGDCDACRAAPIACAAAETARFAHTAAIAEADEALFSVWCAMDEGIRWPDAMPFEEWIVTIALPAAWELRELSQEELQA